MRLITENFGTLRGAIRLGLSYGEVAVGQGAVKAPDAAAVRRLVFVCHGNICRSAFADAVGQQLGLRTASFGLSTDAGRPAYPATVSVAQRMGYDLAAHRAARAEDFVGKQGDLLLGMETRHLRKLAADPRLVDFSRTLLGLFTLPVLPHLHDPYELDPAYMPVCLKRIERAVINLAAAFPGAKAS